MVKAKICLVFGGKSGEHEVSIRSARSIYQALDRNKYEVVLAGIDKGGDWHVMGKEWLLAAGLTRRVLPAGKAEKIIPAQVKDKHEIDVFFPIVHGTNGEDGTLQGLFELLDVAYVGAGVLGSAVGMDKDVQKRLLMQAGIPVAKYQVIYDSRDKIYDLNYPVFVKPANLGSSVGVSRVFRQQALDACLEKAFQYDTKVLIEEEVVGRELEVSVLGNENPIASVPGEVIPQGSHEFYDYEAKYLDEDGAKLEIPVKGLSKSKIKQIQKLAVKTFKTLECAGMARVDMFLLADGRLVVNEINTLPGFTSISMYPKLWEASGVPYPMLLDKLIELALEKKRGKGRLKRSFD